MDVRYFLVVLFFLVSCMPEAQVSKGNLASTSPATTGGTTSGSTPVPELATSWNYLGSTGNSITINVSNLNNAYLIGSQIENFLNIQVSGSLINFTNANYCLVSDYSLGGLPYQLRSRIIPISYYDFAAKRTVRVFRVDFNDVTNSNSFCNSTLKVQNASGVYVTDPSTPAVFQFDPKLICPTCTSMLTATRVRIFKKGMDLEAISTTTINTNSLGLLLDPNNTGSSGPGICSNSECISRGYNCCLDNQCVIDGGTRPSATSLYYSQWQVAEQQIITNPLAYINYPHIYYVCGTTTPPATTGGSSGGGGGSYDAAFEQVKKDYKCLKQVKAQSSLTPFHNEVLNRPTPYDVNETTHCLPTTSPNNALIMQYIEETMKRLYTTCGCSRTILSEMISSCPAYEYTATLSNTLGEPTKIDCYTPPASTPVPTQQTVSVNSRSTPHRFFESLKGIEKDILAGDKSYTSSGVTNYHMQEGDIFEYMDNGKVLPVQANFGMNSILGQMSVHLDQALPAKSVNVELDQVYLISTTSGYYTPCPTCARDSWLSAFTAFPSSAMGAGLQAVGHSTQRDSLSTNNTGGNYEDTIFGRACWVPPTMLPFTHVAESTSTDPQVNRKKQREKRLNAQAALYVNGYQRDWFGFNKGALIGSFDGVSWFAIGKGRIVKSTTKKLYLAINAPFADLASPTLHVVNVQAYDGHTQAAQVDYDPQYHLSHPYQNEAGNCQANHMCSTDTDCVTRLGWEYMCADVKDIKSQWPTFSVTADENPGGVEVRTLDQILHQKSFPSSSTKRCVYRGAGALCLSNSTLITEANMRKNMTCAPNFHCANLATSQTFNSKVARYGAKLEDIPVSNNHLFGKDANILGRPLNYINSGVAFPATSRTAIVRSLENIDTIGTLANSYAGLCRPGKALPDTSNQLTMSNPFNQHANADAGKRTDYINQIASCNSTLFTNYRHSSCPVISNDGNYEMFDPAADASTYHLRASNQNACGLESLRTDAPLTLPADSLSATYSPFKNIEGKPLTSQLVAEPTLVRDACLRRAGQVCHTNLDCSPNKFHGDVVDSYPLSYFGNEAERTYYRESLICGQQTPQPFQSDIEAFKSYQMNQNRCCREVGNDLTTFTANIPKSTLSGDFAAGTAGLKSSLAPGTNPKDPLRYSRLATVERLGHSERPVLSADHSRNVSGSLTSVNNIMTPHQWRTLNEANSDTCCGGGWIRKFSDGTNDWSRRDRLYLDVSSFSCLNSRNILLTNPSDVIFPNTIFPATAAANSQYNSAAIVQNLVSLDRGDYCKDAVGVLGSCAQYSFVDSIGEVFPVPDSYSSITLNTVSPQYNFPNQDFYFTPRSADSNPQVFIDFSDTGGRRNIRFKMPSFVPQLYFDNIHTTKAIQMTNESGTVNELCVNTPALSPAFPTPDPIGQPTDNGAAICPAGCCYSFDTSTRLFKAVVNGVPAFNGKTGIRFSVEVAGSYNIPRYKPGNNTYYLKRLGKLELSGIPQISYEALRCSDNYNRIVPGIYKSNIQSIDQFEANTFSFTSGGTRYTTTQGLQSEPIFSANDYKCCMPLGKTTTDTNKCCSGFGLAQDETNTKFTCALPSGTDLMVYFNRFVSNEGQGSDQPGGGLTDLDFDNRTGEPFLTSTINDKIRELGISYCASGKVRQGGAFGLFEPQPQGNQTVLTEKIYGILDSSRDIGQNSNAGKTVSTGYNAFMDGFRWNHHLYCND